MLGSSILRLVLTLSLSHNPLPFLSLSPSFPLSLSPLFLGFNLSLRYTISADGPNFKIQKIIDGGLCPRMVEFLMAEDKSLVAPALRAVGNILTGDDVQTQVGHVSKTW